MDDQPPVSEGETHEVEISAVGEKGDGIGRVRGFVLFIPGVKKGDYVKVRITKVLPKVGFAEVVERKGKPVREKRFETINPEEVEKEEEPEEHYEDTEDFGEDVKEE